MATPDVSVHMEEVVVVTTPDTAADGSGVEEVKTVLVTTNLAPHGGDLTEDNMDTENAAAAAAAAFTASSQLKEAMLGREPAFWQWRPQAAPDRSGFA